MKTRIFLTVVLLLCGVNHALAQTTAFTYQGKLTDNGSPANGNYDLKFALFDDLSAGIETNHPQTLSNVPVVGGLFTVTLNFGPTAFVGPPRFLEISARPTGVGDFTRLTPRQPISSAPYAV